MYGSDFKHGEFSITGTINETYEVTALTFSPGRITGYLIGEDHVFERRSNLLSSSLSECITDLLGKNIEGADSISSENSFYQFNETDLECATRLLDMTGQDTVWAIYHNKIRVFPRVPKSDDIKSINIGSSVGFSFNRSRFSETNFRGLQGESDRYNIFYGRYSVPVPRLSPYSRDAVASAIQKRKYRDGWSNIYATKTYNNYPNLEIGDSVHFQDMEISPIVIPDFVVTGRTIIINRKNINWVYEFTSDTGWTENG